MLTCLAQYLIPDKHEVRFTVPAGCHSTNLDASSTTRVLATVASLILKTASLILSDSFGVWVNLP